VVHDRLKPITSAYFDSSLAPTGCLEGTRVATHRKLADWANGGTSDLTTLWLNGMAGTGKTAIASTFARDMKEQGILGATFFVDRQEAQRRDLSRIVQTLAYDLAKDNYRQLEAVWTVLRDDPTFERLSFEKQVRHLIKEPLEIVLPETLVIVIDGLDECGAANGASLLETLVRSLEKHPIKLFVTSRNETQIVNTLRGLPHTPYKLQDIEISMDVQLYWEHSLDGLKCIPDWRSMVTLDELVELTGYLFIYATTLFDVIQDTNTSPIKELVKLLEISRAGSGTAIAFADPSVYQGPLEKLYLHILTETMKDKRGNIRPEYALRVHDILEVVIFAREPITPQALCDLLTMDKDELDNYLLLLRSVLVVPEATHPGGVVRPLHQSFPDFVRQHGGLIHPQLAMHITIADKNVAERCFFEMNRHLCFDICDIKDASLFNNEVSDLPSRLNKRVPAALRYSCTYWPSHLLEYIQAAGSESQVTLGMATFCEQHLLHWIEVLSLTEDMNAVQRVMPQLISLMNVRFSHS
jgi:hypothetical protein